MNDDTPEVERIRRQMDYLRGELHEEYDAIVHGAKVLTDWRHYVKTYPWLCVGAAAAVGFLAVPKRLEVMSPDADTLEELSRRNKLVVKAKPKLEARGGGLMGPLVGLVANAALRAMIAYAGQKTGKMFGHNAAAEPAHERYPR